MGVQDVKIRNTAKDLTIGIGGHLIKDVTDNSHKVLVKKVISLKNSLKKTFHKYLLSIQLGQSISELKKLLKSQFPILWEGGVKKKLFRDKIFYGFSQS